MDLRNRHYTYYYILIQYTVYTNTSIFLSAVFDFAQYGFIVFKFSNLKESYTTVLLPTTCLT